MAQNIHWTLASNERCISEFEILNEKLEIQLKADLKKEIYTQNGIQEKEIAIIEYLAKLKKLKEEVLTPESDVFVTPQSSPTDIRYSFGQTRCVSDSGLSSLIESTDSKYLHSTNTLYYSLVTIDECTCESVNILEKELAEQDQLFKSFKSIISRDSKSSKSEVKPLTLASPLSRPLNLRNTSKNKTSIKKVRNKDLELKLCIKSNLKDEISLKNFKNGFEAQQLKNVETPKKYVIGKIPVCHSNVKEIDDVSSYLSFDGLYDGIKDCKSSIMSKTKLEPDEIMEVESVGADSCLEAGEAGSSGYLTGSSPRDHTVSDAFGGDLTEVATSDDIPHDNDQSARSSSMSSDAGTWDATFPSIADGPTKDQNSGDNVKKFFEINNQENTLSVSNGKNHSCETFKELYPTAQCQMTKFDTTNDLKSIQFVQQENSATLTDGDMCKKYNTDKYVPTQTELTLLDSNSSEATQEELLLDNKESRLLNTKNNFFIDAASLLDENEMSTFSANTLSYNGHELVEGKYFPLSLETEDKQLHNTVINENIEQNEVKSEIEYCTNNENTATMDQNDLEKRRSSLIRRNTFELELDDERLAVLRHEYERHKDKVLNHNNSISSHTNISNEGYESGGSSTLYDQTNDLRNPPNSLPISVNSTNLIQKCEEDAHSPDSLNNDAPFNNVFESCTKEHSTSYSLPFEVNGEISHYKNDHELTKAVCGSSVQKDFDDFNTSHYVSQEKSHDSAVLDMFSSTNCLFKVNNSQAVNKIESTPIISGGVSLKDLSSPEKKFSSPLMNRRKTEFAPILSGGTVIEPGCGEELKVGAEESKNKLSSSCGASWVVDMSKSPTEPIKTQPNSILDINVNSLEKNGHLQKQPKVNNSSLGFFIPLDDPYDDKSLSDSGYKSSSLQLNKDSATVKTESDTAMSADTNTSSSNLSFGFYVDLNEPKAHTENSVEKESCKTQPIQDKKLFSMFIDIGEGSDNDKTKSNTNSPNVFKKRNHLRTHSGVFHSKRDERNRFDDSQMSSESSLELTESDVSKEKRSFEAKESLLLPIKQTSSSSNSKINDKNKKQGFYMFIENEPSPIAQRRNLPSGLQPTSQRHSWNSESHSSISSVSGNNCDGPSKRTHRRSHSISVNKSLEVMFNVDQNENKSSNVSSLVKVSTSNSIGYESGPSSIDDTSSKNYNKSMMASWHGSIKPSTELQKVLSKSERKDNKDIKTTSVNKSTLESSINVVNERELELLEKSDELAYSSSKGDELYDLSNTSNESSNTGIHNSTFVISDISNVANATSSELEITTPTCDIASQLSKDDSDKTETDFDDIGERKSDVPKTPDHSMSQIDIPVVENTFNFVKLSDMDKEPKKIPIEEKNVVNRMSRSIPEASWIESKIMTRSATSRSLSRLFPHLNTSARNLTPDSADHDTDFSEISSMQSSMDPSVLEGSTEETDGSSCASRPVSRLGEDLLRMFLDEISPDVTVEVGGRRIKAHKCILSSRCQYFAAILSGGWVESAGNVISLQGFSYNAVHFALCHIYSGASNIPDSINIVELATLADMLCLEGLKEVIMYTLKVKYCHFFHKPCPMCTVGVLECLPLAAAYGLDEIYRKSLRWITKYFVRVWPTKGFATLPRELLDKCYKQHIVHMTVDNALETVLSCSKLQGLIPNVRWAEPVFALTTKLYDAVVKFIAQHFCEILSSDIFMSLGKEQLWTMSRLEETLLSAAEKLPPDQACKCHSHLYKLVGVVQSPPSLLNAKLNDGFVEFLNLLSTTVENCLLKQAARASRTPAWTLMEPQLRHKIQDAACLVIVPGDDRRRARHLLKKGEVLNSGKRSVDLLPAKSAVTDSPVSKKVSHSTRPSTITPVKPKTTQSTSKGENNGSRPKTWPYKISEVKSRYLEPKATPKQSPALSVGKQEKPTLTPTARRNVSKSIISSSDSSRTSSPAMRRSVPQRASRSLPSKESTACSKKEDNLTVSTDSLTDPSMSGPKKKGEGSINRHQPFSRIDFVEKNMRSLSVKSTNIKGMTSDSIDSKGKPAALAKVESDKLKNSPVPLSLRSSSQSSPRVKDSPIPQVKSAANSTPSPSVRRSTISSKERSSNPSDTKSVMLKRTSTYRVQAKSSSPVKVGTAKPREPIISPNTKGNLNKIQSKVHNSKKSVVNNNIVSNVHKTETKVQPMVGSRSGTFLKDEPTVLKKPQVVNVSE